MEKDVTWGVLFEDNERFADFVNCFGCDGVQIVRDEDVQSEDAHIYYRNSKGRQSGGIGKIRDTVRRVAFGINFCIIGIENQETIDYSYPLREMSYTVGNYERQKREITRTNQKKSRKEKDQSALLYGFGKDDRLKPTITFLLYAGEDEWSAGTDLYSMLDFDGVPDVIREKIQNYHVHLIEIRKLDNEKIAKLKTDLKSIFQFIRYSSDKQQLLDLVTNDEYFRTMNEDAYFVAANYTHSRELIEKNGFMVEEGRMDMCRAIRELILDGKMEGIAAGKAESVLMLLRRHGKISDELEREMMSISDEEILGELLLMAASVKSVAEFEAKMKEFVLIV